MSSTGSLPITPSIARNCAFVGTSVRCTVSYWLYAGAQRCTPHPPDGGLWSSKTQHGDERVRSVQRLYRVPRRIGRRQRRLLQRSETTVSANLCDRAVAFIRGSHREHCSR